MKIKGRWFVDETDRIMFLRGVNLAGSSKLPIGIGSHTLEGFFDHRHVSFVGRPFPLKEADEHFMRIKAMGFNFLRFVITWESIEHEGPGIYDVSYFDYLVNILEKARVYELKCFIDPHQDVWSRFTGGSGAPGWTLELVGFDMTKFAETGAAIVHATYDDPENFPRMIWPTNYYKLAAATMFTLFFGGNAFAPCCRVKNGEDTIRIFKDGEFAKLDENEKKTYMGIQDYLQNRFFNAITALINHIKSCSDLLDTVIIAYLSDTLNEPSGGFIGCEDLGKHMNHQDFKSGLTPTPIQTMLLGNGKTCLVENWEFGVFGPRKVKVLPWNERRVSCWKHSCIWEAHGIYDSTTGELHKPSYFNINPVNGKSVEWKKDFWMPFALAFIEKLHNIHPTAITFIEPPVNEIPPEWTGSKSQICYAPHWYDGLTLINKVFSKIWTIDYIGLKRGRYSNVLAALSFGIDGIKNNFSSQLNAIKSEGLSLIGESPCVIGEIGIPFDMNNKSSYSTHGTFKLQNVALDANISALERNLLNFTLWNYSSDNSHQWGDNWNGEDLSVFSRDDTLRSGSGILQGIRAVESLLRPFPSKVHGIPQSFSYDFNSKSKDFRLKYEATECCSVELGLCTEIFYPLKYLGSNLLVEGKGTWTFDEKKQMVLFFHDDPKTASEVQIKISIG